MSTSPILHWHTFLIAIRPRPPPPTAQRDLPRPTHRTPHRSYRQALRIRPKFEQIHIFRSNRRRRKEGAAANARRKHEPIPVRLPGRAQLADQPAVRDAAAGTVGTSPAGTVCAAGAVCAAGRPFGELAVVRCRPFPDCEGVAIGGSTARSPGRALSGLLRRSRWRNADGHFVLRWGPTIAERCAVLGYDLNVQQLLLDRAGDTCCKSSLQETFLFAMEPYRTD